MKYKTKFKDLTFEQRCRIVSDKNKSLKEADQDPEVRSMINALHSNQEKKRRSRKKALKAILEMRGLC